MLHFFNFLKELEKQERRFVDKSWEEMWLLLLNYLPTITMALVNGVVPLILNKIALIEKWDPMKELETKLLRLVFLKLLSLAALIYSLYQGLC